MREEAFLFGHTRSLVGIITNPPQAVRGHHLPAIIFLNAGIVHRVGPNRFYVKLARRLAAMGFVVLRFDFSGIGDSKAREDALPFDKSSVSEVQEAINTLRDARGIARCILIGLCSGAVIALQTAWTDPRVIGTVLINGQSYYNKQLDVYVKNRQTAQAYKQGISYSLPNRKSWSKILTGQAHYWSILKTIVFLISFPLLSRFTLQRNVSSEVDHLTRDLHVLAARGVRLLLIYSEQGRDFEYCKVTFGHQIHQLQSDGTLTIEIIPQANHTFDALSSQDHLFSMVQEWIQPMMQH